MPDLQQKNFEKNPFYSGKCSTFISFNVLEFLKLTSESFDFSDIVGMLFELAYSKGELALCLLYIVLIELCSVEYLCDPLLSYYSISRWLPNYPVILLELSLLFSA